MAGLALGGYAEFLAGLLVVRRGALMLEDGGGDDAPRSRCSKEVAARPPPVVLAPSQALPITYYDGLEAVSRSQIAETGLELMAKAELPMEAEAYPFHATIRRLKLNPLFVQACLIAMGTHTFDNLLRLICVLFPNDLGKLEVVCGIAARGNAARGNLFMALVAIDEGNTKVLMRTTGTVGVANDGWVAEARELELMVLMASGHNLTFKPSPAKESESPTIPQKHDYN
ncbi:hypothetical protein K490DRAFT_65264 [Saccharata proteae CBS 121410]|uniref:Uncharacterized protein n=1 Tax=Saccharata proteae CBS 121410 TaxID=1314787 RepID=A0A9P4HTY2_9PEZI|nr:hypothetical protein K490DRAFT_65264 [Saccharata proteae CBS 121410]